MNHRVDIPRLSPTHPGRRLASFFLALATLAFAWGCSSSGGTGSDAAKEAAWTVMVYMAADNDLWSAGIADINEMEAVGSSIDVNVVVQAEFKRAYPEGAPGNAVRGLVTPDHDLLAISSRLSDIGRKDMTDPETLLDFIAWAKESYPAKRYALVIWNHGNGWKDGDARPLGSRGVILDDSSGSSLMSLPELAQALALSGVRLDLVDFDACYMAMYEVAYELADLSGYLAFSEDTTPADGNPYTEILWGLSLNPDMDGRELAMLVVSEYRRCYGTPPATRATKSAFDLSLAPLLHASITSLAGTIMSGSDRGADLIGLARESSVHCSGKRYYHDLGSLLDALSSASTPGDVREAALRCRQTLQLAVIDSTSISVSDSDPALGMCGLSIYLPEADEATQEDLSLYGELACNRDRAEGGATWADLLSAVLLGR